MSQVLPNTTTFRLAVVTPLANEARTIESFLDQVIARLGTHDKIFCVLDTISKDGTRDKIDAYSRKEPRVVLIWAPENRCVVDAYFRGYHAAYDAGAQYILEMDGGMSHLPVEIPRFLEKLEQGYDYVGGCRFMPGGSHRGQLSRRLISWGGTVLANLLLGTTMRDMTSGFELFSRKAMALVLAQGVRSRAHFFQTEIKFMLRDSNWVEVPITYTNTSNGFGGASVTEALRHLWALRKEARNGS